MDRLRAWIETRQVPLTEPYTIAYETVTDVVNHFLIVEDEHGNRGIGCSAPAPEVTGETADMARKALVSWCASPTFNHDLTASAGAAVDLALFDLKGRTTGQSAIELLGGSTHAPVPPRETSITIGIQSITDTLKRAKALVDQGFRFLKVKGGHDVQIDIERLLALRDRWGRGIRLSLDANQGYSIADLRTLDQHSREIELAYMEQPTPKTDLRMLAEAAQTTVIPVMADESVQSVQDVDTLAEFGGVALINIKLQKMGGLTPALAIDEAARLNGIRSMLGCMDESALSIAAALHFAAARPNVQFLDLDGHLDLSDDPMAAMVKLDDAGRLSADSLPGLGWHSSPFGEVE